MLQRNCFSKDSSSPKDAACIVWKVSKYGFSPNTGKYGPEITPYLDTFHDRTN